ncbi:MAG: InlB B-repeat-containing protein [Blautia sp.]|nr:InlB B-repeat-containing protein [Blautia sp.]
MLYNTYVESTENALGMQKGSAKYIRLFDIKIVDKDNPNVKYQPREGTTVSVKIELADSESEQLNVVHFADENTAGDIVDAEHIGQTVSFAAGGFSVYAIADTAETDPSGTVSRKYLFYTDGTFTTDYTFVNKEGENTSVQYVTEGGLLYNPDAPAEQVDGKQFVGWADENGTIILEPGTESIVITGITGTGSEVKLYPRYEEVYYIEYYDEHHNVYKTESSVNGDFTMSGKTASLTDNGEYRITYQPDDSEEAFMGWSLEDRSLDTVTQVDFAGDADKKIEVYPAKAKVFWINFDKNDAGGTSKATYTAPVWVLQTDDKVSDRHTSLPESTRPGYEFGGWYTDPECTTEFNMNTHLTGDVTLYANWIPSDQTYTVVILKQRISDSVTATADEKTYDYETSYTLHGTTGSTASVPNQYKNLNYDGFNYARCDANTTIAADGSTVLYVYYDRKIITFNFYLYGTTGATTNYTVINESTANTNYNNRTDVYGDYQGTKVVLTRTSSTSTRAYLSEYNYNGAPEYTDTVYEIRNGYYVQATEPYSTRKTYYYRYWDGWRWRWSYDSLYWRTETTTTYTWYTPDGNEYNGTFYQQTQTAAGTRWYIWKTMTGLYGSSLNGEWPSEYWWYSGYSGSTGNGTRTTFLDAFLPAGTSTEVNYYGNTGSGTSSIRFYQQDVNGETYSLPNGGTVTSTNNSSFNLTDKYNGFHIAEYRTRRNGVWSSWIQPGELMLQSGSYYYDADPNSYGYQYIQSGFSDLEIRYDRNIYTIDFLDGFSHSNTELADPASVLYGSSLENVDPGSPDVTHEGYSFTGWYTDPDCKNLFDFSTETMPANNLVLYAGWEKQRFRVWVQPNGGILSPTESTFFRSDYGDLIQEYSDVEITGRDYYASDDGEYSYIYICDPENHDQARVAYYKKTSELGVITLQKEDENGNIINDVYDEREHTDGKKYTYQKGVYDFVGWYRVGGEISEEVPPAILESDELTLWNFNTPVKEPLAIRAIWKRVGSFRVGYDKNMYDEEGNEIVLPGAPDAEVPPTTLYTYGDLSQAIVGSAPTKVPQNYTFVGWKTPAGEIVQPNDTITIHSTLANLEDGTDTSNPKYIYTLTAVYKQLDVTTLSYDANGGTGTLTDLNGTAAESEDAVYGTNEITKLELNSRLELSRGTGFSRKNYHLIGWNDDKDAADNEIVKYELGGTYGIDDPEGNTLYAVWTSYKIRFTKNVSVEGSLAKEQVNHSIYIALTKEDKETYVRDEDGNILVKEIRIINGVPTPETVVFDGLEDGDYNVWELKNTTGSRLGVSDVFPIQGANPAANFAVKSITGNNNAFVSEADPTDEVTLTNTYAKEDETPIKFEVNKVWIDRQANEISSEEMPDNATATLSLYRKINGQIEADPIGSITLDGHTDETEADFMEDEPWHANFGNLPRLNDQGNRITYVVKETAATPDGYYPWKQKSQNNDAYGPDEYLENSGGTIYNRKLTMSVRLDKHFDFQPNNGDEQAMTYEYFKTDKATQEKLSFTVTLPTGEVRYYKLSDFEPVQGVTTFSLTLEDIPYYTGLYAPEGYNGSTITFQESGEFELLEAYNYYLVNITPDNGQQWNIGSTRPTTVTATRTESMNVNANDPLYEVRIQNKYRRGAEGKLVKLTKKVAGLTDDDFQANAEKLSNLHFVILNKAGYYAGLNPTPAFNPATMRYEKLSWVQDVSAAVIISPSFNYNGNNGQWEAEFNLSGFDYFPSGEYTIVELEMLEDGYNGNSAQIDGYVLTVKDNTITVETHSGDTSEWSDSYNYDLSITNAYERIAGSVSFSKVDEEMNALPGAVFRLYTDETCETPAKDINGQETVTASAAETGLVEFSNIPIGTYYMKETAAPKGYVLSNQVYEVVLELDQISENTETGTNSFTTKYSIRKVGESEEITQIPNKRDRKIRIRKIGNDTPDGLTGAVFSLTADGVVEGFTDITGITSMPDGSAVLVRGEGDDATTIREFELPIGKYTLTETTAPEYYEGLKKPVGLTVTSSGVTLSAAEGDMAEIEYSEDEDVYTITINNTRKLAHVTVIKNVDGLEGDNDIPFEFSAESLTDKKFSLYGAEKSEMEGDKKVITQPHQIVFADIPYGTTFTVEETADKRFSTTYTVKVGDSQEDSVVKTGIKTDSITVTDNITVTFTNTRKITDITLKKVKSGSTVPLKGATFKLYHKNIHGAYVSDEEIEAAKADKVLELTEGVIKVEGLPSGDYKLTETKAPDGYIILARDIFFTVNASGEGEVITLKTSADSDDDTFDLEMTGISVEGTNKDTLVIPNTPGAALPNTGGPGTNLIYLLGIMLTGIAGAGLMMRKRKQDII